MSRFTVYNNIVTEEKWKKVNPNNIQLGEDWLEYLQSVDRSPQTLQAYRNDLRIFWVWCLDFNNNKYFPELTKREVAKFQNHALNTWGWGSSRIRRVKSCLSSLSNYIQDILDDEPEFENYKPIVRKIENPAKVARREKTVLTDEQVEYLLATLVEQKKFECACAIAIAAYSGMRHGELLQMKPVFFDDEHFVYESMWKTDKVRAKGHGKEGTPLNKFVLYGAKPYIDLWMNEREEKGIDSDWMFVTVSVDKNKNRIYNQRKDTSTWVDWCEEILGVDFYLHSLRHFTCTKLHRMNLPSHVIQEFFGWASSEMLKIYNDLTAEDEFGKYFGKNGIKEIKQGSLTDI
ncbi:tyrosine-type recombinase/integrase [Lactonifactor sp. BIOML-A3]|uniref:tyrosine-type recombinase/integrase n=1 Tax=unclassified Lactonifactor TaxID=2636670 RepID=UPI0012AFD64E|nr:MULTISPECIES: tyrosine-type recombinase/integrase [unclassified Lactonifactor]MSA02163.1 tyrosine-type recombinase/integrase [Lactonifactor sp. BIOML-A5]MSA07948.1 tyrosine-type recombinase/integrase [Lactonifactor sp. BIOML-A4]MSA12564.1 tyrosine-type recombinase/integrase [Lactonifactor sp. BIOML-A3]MSA16735.1 tyrosine-type recombinase/integrase [Lactonifactor sp. BIOML-A2]MSA37566.1 tyrosine-type recombinase/integrase [Lactonifactor sp. BIOML-A1]